MKSSFVRKGKASASPSSQTLPPGTKLSPHNGALQISSGLADLDDIIGGGITVGSLLLVEEDVYSDYNQLLLKYFIGEGIANKQQIHIAAISTDQDASEKWIKKLPFVSGAPPVQAKLSTPSPPAPVPTNKIGELEDISSSKSNDDGIKIAWQYRKYISSDKDVLSGTGSKRTSWCHSFDMLKHMEPSYISQAEVSSSSFKPASTEPKKSPDSVDTSRPYQAIYNNLNKLIQSNNELLASGEAPKITRIGLISIGNPFFASHYSSSNGSLLSHGNSDMEHKNAILQFFRAMRGLLRQSLATCVISFPTHLFQDDQKFLQQLRHSCDAVVQFSAFTDSDAPVSPAFAEFDGIFTVVKLPRINTLVSTMPAHPRYTFQFKRKKLVIEKIHLPPDLSVLESTQKSNEHNHDHHDHSGASGLLCSTNPSQPSVYDF